MRNSTSAGPLKALKDKMQTLRNELEETRELHEQAERGRLQEIAEREKVWTVHFRLIWSLDRYIVKSYCIFLVLLSSFGKFNIKWKIVSFIYNIIVEGNISSSADFVAGEFPLARSPIQDLFCVL